MPAPALWLVPLARQPLYVDFPETPPIEVVSLSAPPLSIEQLADPVEVVLTMAARGPAGPPGSDAAAPVIFRTAGEAIGGHRGVSVDDVGTAWYADPNVADLRVPAGLTVGAAAFGGTASIQVSGSLEELSWSWAPGAIYLAPLGLLTQAAPASGAVVIVGYATGPTSMRIDPQLVALLN